MEWLFRSLISRRARNVNHSKSYIFLFYAIQIFKRLKYWKVNKPSTAPSTQFDSTSIINQPVTAVEEKKEDKAVAGKKGAAAAAAAAQTPAGKKGAKKENPSDMPVN